MHINSKLRYIIDLYGKKLGWDFPLYDIYKERVLHIEKASELDDKKKQTIIDGFKFGLQELEEGLDKIEAKVNILDLFIKNKKDGKN